MREDLAFSERQAHLVLAVMKAMDHDQGPVVEVVAQARRRHPEWPVVVAQTSLHEAYAWARSTRTPIPSGSTVRFRRRRRECRPTCCEASRRSAVRRAARARPVAFVALDFTRESDGYRPADYGHDALIETLRATAPAGSSPRCRRAAAGGARERAAHPHIVGYATAAAAADVVPLAGFVAVPGVQAKMLHSLGLIYGIEWDRRTLGEFAAALGTGTALRALSAFGIREIAKLIPVYGQTAGAAAAAAASFAMTYALGKAAGYFLARRRRGPVAPGDGGDLPRGARRGVPPRARARRGPNRGSRRADGAEASQEGAGPARRDRRARALLPTLSLLPLGSLWLWERGLLLYWALAACAATLAAFGFQHWLLRPTPRAERHIAATSSAADPSWSPAEQAAWTAVLEIAGGIRAEDLGSRDSALALGQRTVEAVARKLHPDVEEPLLRFTVPEALALVEQVSRRMRPLVADSIPLGDQLTVAQVMKLYRWRSAIDMATRAYDLWRIVRLFNPLSAATHELREQFSKKMYELGKDALARRLGRSTCARSAARRSTSTGDACASPPRCWRRTSRRQPTPIAARWRRAAPSRSGCSFSGRRASASRASSMLCCARRGRSWMPYRQPASSRPTS